MEMQIKIKGMIDASPQDNADLRWFFQFAQCEHFESRSVLLDGKRNGYTEFTLNIAVESNTLLDFLQREDVVYLDTEELV